MSQMILKGTTIAQIFRSNLSANDFNGLKITNTGEVTSKVAVIVSINRQFWLICVGLPTKYGI